MIFIWFATILHATPPKVESNRARVIWASELSRKGQIELLIDVADLPSGIVKRSLEDYSAEVGSGKGRATVTNISPVESTEEVYTVLAFDDSKSITKKDRKLFLQAANTFRKTAPQSNHKYAIITCGQACDGVLGKNLEPSEIPKKIESLRKENYLERNTLLVGFLERALEDIKDSSAVQDGGIRQIILFSDGLDSGTVKQSDVDAVVDKSRKYGVQIHFLFSAFSEKNPDIIDKYKMFEKVAKETGGEVRVYAKGKEGNLDDGAEAIAKSIPQKVRLTIDFCDVESSLANFKDTIKVNFHNKEKIEAWTSIQFTQKLISETKDACPCKPECNTFLQECVKSECTDKYPSWLMWLCPLLALLLPLLLFLTRRRQAPPPPPPPPSRPDHGEGECVPYK